MYAENHPLYVEQPPDLLLDSSTVANNSFPIVISDPTIKTYTNLFLQYFLPTITAINIPLSLTNFIVFLNTGFLNSPSNLIYFNLVIVDLLNSAVGIKISVNLWNDRDHNSATFWGEKTQTFSKYIYNFTFDTNIMLVFGLSLIRVLWTEMSALHVLRRLKVVSGVTVFFAYVYGTLSCFNRYHLEKHARLRPRLLFPTGGIEAKDIFQCYVIFSIVYMCIYTQARIWLNKSLVRYRMFLAASKGSLIVTLNVVVSYSYYILMIGIREYHKLPGNNEFTCPGDKVNEDTGDEYWTVTDLLLCDELYLSVTFMCFQCTINSLILLFQRQSRRFLRMRGRLCVRDVRRVCSECYSCTCGEDPDYEYL